MSERFSPFSKRIGLGEIEYTVQHSLHSLHVACLSLSHPVLFMRMFIRVCWFLVTLPKRTSFLPLPDAPSLGSVLAHFASQFDPSRVRTASAPEMTAAEAWLFFFWDNPCRRAIFINLISNPLFLLLVWVLLNEIASS